MTTALQIPIKYCKSLMGPEPAAWSDLTAHYAARFWHKLLYEWWGFCVNGSTDLYAAGGIVGSHMPMGFHSGTVVMVGTDGFTTFGYDVFASESSDFLTMLSGSLSGSLQGKYLVTWIPGSPGLAATDDGVYEIKSVDDANHLRVEVFNGGTRRLGNKPVFWDRQNINFRIVDIFAACALSGWQGIASASSYQVLEFQSAPTVNPGQATSQVQIFTRVGPDGTGNNAEGVLGLVFSPGGTWNVASASFSDGTVEQQVTFFNLTGSGGTGNTAYTLIGGTDFIIAEVRGPQTQGNIFGGGSGFHIEIPQRLYPQADDPNPIAWLTWFNSTPNQIAQSYYDGFSMVCEDSQVRTWTTKVRSPGGDRVRIDYYGGNYENGQWQMFQVPNNRFWNISFDPVGDQFLHNDQYMTTDGILSLATQAHFSAARARLRHVRFTAATLPSGARIGDPITDANGWVVVANGVLWPWDDSIMPVGPWRFGV